MFKHILVPTDGSPLSQLATAKAIEFALAINAKLTFMTVLSVMMTDFDGHEGIPIDRSAELKELEHLKERARAILAGPEAQAKAAKIECATVVHTSPSPHEGIINASHELKCDLILMASRGHKGVKGLVLGSETHKVLTNSKIPVLVYR
jgi:nucleotide-binding universal stress UspA family protein